VWQALRQQLYPRGLEIVSVALDTGGSEAAGPWIEAAKAQHPSLVDPGHVLDELLGVVNVPNGVWIDEEGIIVRPAEPAWIERLAGAPPPEDDQPSALPTKSSRQAETSRQVRAEVSKMHIHPEQYRAMIYDWVERGPASRYALAPEEVLARSQPRSAETARAAAHFEIGQHLHRAGNHDAAIVHWREAHRLQPENWTYKRQAWNLETSESVGRIDAYGAGWLEDVQRLGAESYYPEIVP
jgi:hypothetical protein